MHAAILEGGWCLKELGKEIERWSYSCGCLKSTVKMKKLW